MHRHALLIGCNKGKGLTPLEAAQSDAERVRTMLCRHTSWNRADVSVLLGNVTHRDIDNAIEALKQQLAAGDFVLVYYAGHAAVHASDYCLQLPGESYGITDLLDAFITTEEQIRSLLVIDACFSGRAAVNAFAAFLRKLAPKSHEPHSTQPALTRAIIAASAPNQPARERTSGGVMTTAFLSAAEHGGTDLLATSQGVATLETVSNYVKGELGRQQELVSLVYGGGFDVKTNLDWRLRMGGSREYRSDQFLMLAEDTRMWYPTDNSNSKPDLIGASWGGDPPKIALGFQGQPVKIQTVDHAQRKLIDVNEIQATTARNGVKVSSNGEQVGILKELDGLAVFPTLSSTRTGREFKVRPSKFLVTIQNLLVTCTPAGAVQMWTLKSNRSEAVAQSNSLRAGNHMRAFPDGSAVVTGSPDPGQAIKWSLPSLSSHSSSSRGMLSIEGSVISPEPVGAFGKLFGESLRVAICPDGDLIAVGFGGRPGRIRVWNSNELSTPMADVVYPEHKSFITALEFSADGKYVASGCADGEVYVTSIRDHKQHSKIRLGDGDYVTALAFSQLGQDPALAVGTNSGSVVIYVLAGPTPKPLEYPGRGRVYRLALLASHDHPMQVLVAAQRGFECWDIA
jgi:caspase domain-containing protein/WD40 domain-containing protein